MKLHPTPRSRAQVEPLEARIAPAIVLTNPLPDIVAGSGKTGATIDLSEMFDPAAQSPNRTVVELITNVDIDPVTPGLQAGRIVLELYDDAAPLTVQNFLAYVNNTNKKGDYDNTYFHRAGDGFVLQGGGFEASTPTKHIPTLPTVHNEPDPVNRSNLLGTVAMAKVGGDPNSASSEWFINLGDNSANLDAQNGGFTVFGRVLEGLDFAQAIADLPYFNTGSDGTGTPAQNYDPDPDDNPSTPSPTPTLDQFVRIVDARVVPTTGNADGINFSIKSIVVPGTTTSSNLLTGSITGTTLNLKYVADKSGVAEVTVAGMKDGVEIEDTFLVDVKPNLIVDITSDGLQGVVVPGDTATVKLNLTNNGAAAAIGTADILVGLLKMNATRNAQGQITGFTVDTTATPITIAMLSDIDLDLDGGKVKSFTTKVQVPSSGLAPEDAATDFEGTVYKLIAQVNPTGGDIDVNERFTDDNTEQLGRQHHAMNRFGTFNSDFSSLFGGRTNAALTYTDTDTLGAETLVTWTMKGAGSGRLTLQTSGGVMLETFATDAASALNAKVGKAGSHVPLESAQLYTTLGAANLGSIDLEDFLFASGGLKTLTLGDVQGPALIAIGIFPPDNTTTTTLKFGRVQNLSLESSMPIASLTAIDWRDTDGLPNDALSTLSLGTLKITGSKTVAGDFEADLTILDAEPVSALTIAGALRNATIQTAGDIAKVTLGGMEASNLFAGVSERPEDLADFSDARTIKSFLIKDGVFIDSQVAAAILGTVKVQGVATASGDSPFGFVADAITSYNRTGGAKLSKLDEPGPFDAVGNYLVQVL